AADCERSPAALSPSGRALRSATGKSHAGRGQRTTAAGAQSMIAAEIRNSVRVLKEQSRSLHEISRLLKLSRNTVRRILRQPDAAASPPCKPQTLARLEDAFARCGGNVVRVRQLLAKEDLEVPYSTLTCWIRKAGLNRPRSIALSERWLTEIVSECALSYAFLARSRASVVR